MKLGSGLITNAAPPPCAERLTLFQSPVAAGEAIKPFTRAAKKHRAALTEINAAEFSDFRF
ncbi:hypothetical protein [Cribrihabitans neustonicus]|uniref:hypothetical protein n=1 Tax=Cribrihabitans neustonicus TaxID=1429085 RepID=UPI003B58BAF7